MALTKLKLGTAAMLCAGLLVAMIGGSFTSSSIAQDAKPEPSVREAAVMALGNLSAKAESDADFIRRISKDLRGTEPTPAEIHFFVACKDAGRRQKLIDLFIQERQAKEALKARADFRSGKIVNMEVDVGGNKIRTVFNLLDDLVPPTPGLGELQKEFYKQLHAAKEKGDVAQITQKYLNRLIDFVKTNPRSQDVFDAMRHIVFMYESQGKTVEAGAWRDKLMNEYPKIVIDKSGSLK